MHPCGTAVTATVLMRTSTLQFRFAVAFRHDVMETELRSRLESGSYEKNRHAVTELAILAQIGRVIGCTIPL